MSGVTSYMKSQPVRSKKLRDSARDQPCTLRLPGCDGGGETSVLAHMPGCGRGMGTKTSDVNAVFSCANCHDIIDHRHMVAIPDAREIDQALIRAHAETLQYWVDSGLLSIKGAA